ncbi:MAG: type II secretion system F family protein [Bdellovibrionota bacterium]
MDRGLILGIIAGLASLISLGIVLYAVLASKKRPVLQGLMQGSEEGSSLKQGIIQSDFDLINAEAKRVASKQVQLTLEDKMFQAGMLDSVSKTSFMKVRVFAPFALTIIGLVIGLKFGGVFIIVMTILGLLIGIQVPISILERRTESRHEDIVYYLPLVIEQIAIGVSSSLDVGPCIARVVQMADERDSHNSVTELLRLVQFQVKSGVSLQEALTETGVRTGQSDLKHAFLALAQVAKHGGEITRQLNELADAVANQRATKIEAKIKKLEIAATGPVALVFLGFLIILLIGFGIQMKDAFG